MIYFSVKIFIGEILSARSTSVSSLTTLLPHTRMTHWTTEQSCDSWMLPLIGVQHSDVKVLPFFSLRSLLWRRIWRFREHLPFRRRIWGLNFSSGFHFRGYFPVVRQVPEGHSRRELCIRNFMNWLLMKFLLQQNSQKYKFANVRWQSSTRREHKSLKTKM